MCFYLPLICDIISGMRIKNLTLLPILSCLMAMPSYANWQYDGEFIGDGWYEDDGARFVMSFRGGGAFGFGSIENKTAPLTSAYYIDDTLTQVISESVYLACENCDNYSYAGVAELDKLPADKNYESFSFSAGGSIGMTLPNRPQWRMEIGWDHISEAQYNATPLFSGDVPLYGGTLAEEVIINAQVGSVHSNVTTDIISAMAFYDFFDGLSKPAGKFIPYVGFGIGYADSKTVMTLTDAYGDLSSDVDLREHYGEEGETAGVLQFNRSETDSSNLAGLLALGFSYGITEYAFFDFGARLTYLPRIKWDLSNADDTRHRSWFNAENVFYANVMLGIRFEF